MLQDPGDHVISLGSSKVDYRVEKAAGNATVWHYLSECFARALQENPQKVRAYQNVYLPTHKKNRP